MKRLLPILFFLLFSVVSTSQDSTILWQNTIGGSNWDILWASGQTPDGGYIVGGWSASNSSGDKTENSMGAADYWVIKLDQAGEIEWQNTIGGEGDDYLYTIALTHDGGYLLGGKSESNTSGDKTQDAIGSFDYWLVKINGAGLIEWDVTIGGLNHDHLWKIKQTADNGFILAGYSNSDISGDKTENSIGSFDFWVVKIDVSGQILWQNTIGGTGYDELLAIDITADEGYILGGESSSGISGDKTQPNRGGVDYWVVKLNQQGEIEWQRTLGGMGDDDFTTVIQTGDSGYLVGGYSVSNISGEKSENALGLDDYWLVKLDGTGQIEWDNTLGGNHNDRLFEVLETTENTYLLAGYSTSMASADKTEGNIGGPDYWLVELNSDGTIRSQNTIGGFIADILTTVHQTTDGGYFLGGYSYSSISGDKSENTNGFWDYWLIRLSGILDTSPFSSELIEIYPNPATTHVYISSDHNVDLFEIYSVSGVKLLQFTEVSNGVDISSLPAGMYLLRLTSATTKTFSKLVKY